MPYKIKPGLVTVSQSGKAVKLDGLAVPSGSDVTKNYVDQQDAETLASAKRYADAELARVVETQAAKDAQQDAAISGKQPKGDYLTEETDPTVPAWAKRPSKPTYTAEEVGALPDSTEALKNPNVLTFTGAVSATYDGSAPVSVEIPTGGSGGSGPATASELTATVPAGLPAETEGNVQAVLDALNQKPSGGGKLVEHDYVIQEDVTNFIVPIPNIVNIGYVQIGTYGATVDGGIMSARVGCGIYESGTIDVGTTKQNWWYVGEITVFSLGDFRGSASVSARYGRNTSGVLTTSQTANLSYKGWNYEGLRIMTPLMKGQKIHVRWWE